MDTAEDIPSWTENDVTITLIAGSAWGHTSLKTAFRIIYLDLAFAPGAKLTLPSDPDDERIKNYGERISDD